MTTAETMVRQSGRSLVPDALFERLTARIVAGHPEIDRPMAERIMDQALTFLAVAGPHVEKLSPSGLVDIGWHTFILHTREYADFCIHVAGRFIDHEPHDDTHGDAVHDADGVTRTLSAINAAGYRVDKDLWTVAAGHNLDCSASGKDGNENTETQIPPPAR